MKIADGKAIMPPRLLGIDRKHVLNMTSHSYILN